MQVVYQYHQKYPFGRVVETDCTFVQVTENFSTEQTLQVSKEKIAMFRKINSKNIMKIRNILREDLVLHYQYEYFPQSLEKYIKNLNSEENLRNVTDQIKTIVNTLTISKIKVQLDVNNMACDDGVIKLFIHPSFLMDEKGLKEFYEAERKKIQIQLEEIFQASHEKASKSTQIKQPNFIIQGNTLIFTNQQDPKRQSKPKVSLTHSDTRDASYQMMNNDNKYRSFQYESNKRGQFYSQQYDKKQGQIILKNVEDQYFDNRKASKTIEDNNPKKGSTKMRITTCQQVQSKSNEAHKTKESKGSELSSIQAIRDKVREAKQKAEAALKGKRDRQ